jgi:hypothetical protein
MKKQPAPEECQLLSAVIIAEVFFPFIFGALMAGPA